MATRAFDLLVGGALVVLGVLGVLGICAAVTLLVVPRTRRKGRSLLIGAFNVTLGAALGSFFAMRVILPALGWNALGPTEVRDLLLWPIVPAWVGLATAGALAMRIHDRARSSPR